jgi:hypothetical protein
MNMDGVSLEILPIDQQQLDNRQATATQYSDFFRRVRPRVILLEIRFCRSSVTVTDFTSVFKKPPIAARKIHLATAKFELQRESTEQIQNVCKRPQRSPFDFILGDFRNTASPVGRR